MQKPSAVVIIGAGPAGLTAAYELAQRSTPPLILEKFNKVGGLSRTEIYKGYRFDIGGHRFYTKIKEVEKIWRDMLGDDFIKVRRLSRIYYKGKFYQYPLNFINALTNLGPIESCLILLSYLKTKFRSHPQEKTFEQWVTNRFGGRLYRTFFQSYTEKVWGISCREIRADWAAQRIQGLSLTKALSNCFFGTNGVKSLIHEFHYPALGPGMMWERFGEFIESRGGEVRLNTKVIRILLEGKKIKGILAQHGSHEEEVRVQHLISTIPLNELIFRLDPPPPSDVLEAAGKLRYRAFILVGLIVNQPRLFPDNWIYVHNPEVRVGRIQNFKNWNAAMVPNPLKTSLGMEYFCNEEDEIWRMPDAGLIEMATRELAHLGLANFNEVKDGIVFRQSHAYPVYDSDYRSHLSVIQNFLKKIENLQTIGRGGMHRYNNQDHSMLTALMAVKNILGESHDLWNINTERSYYEEFAARSSRGNPS